MNLEEFIEKVSKVELPPNHITRVKLLAKETAEGSLERLWSTSDFKQQESYNKYLRGRWGADWPAQDLMVQMGYFTHEPGTSVKIDKSAFDLVEGAPPLDVFISYYHAESSAFALLILNILKMRGLDPFLDMAIPAGDDWKERIKGEIKKREWFIAILGKETLRSSYIRDEIKWAFGWGKIIIPVWHKGFTDKSDPFGLDSDIFTRLNGKQAIPVAEPPSAANYKTAIDKLLNRFGVTP